MKFAISTAVGLGLAASATLLAPQQSIARANDDVQFCKSLVDAQVYQSVGDCVSILRTRPVDLCKNPLVWQFFGFKNQGQCIAFFRNQG